MNRKTLVLIIIILVALLGAGFLIYKYFSLEKEQEQETFATERPMTFNEQIMDFTRFFIDNVLKEEQEIDFETRLLLEQKVKELSDPEISRQWNALLQSQTEEQAQQNTAEFLRLLVDKMNLYLE